jgi:hypothetical protein
MGQFLESEPTFQEKRPYDHPDALAGCEELVPFKYSPLAFGLDLGTLTETFLHALSILIFSMIETFKFATGLQSPET